MLPLFFGLILAWIGVIQVLGSDKCQPIPDPPSADDVNRFVATRFDYLIIGGGTAGVALASRLSANPKLQVGVIEAGSFLQNNSIINEPFNDLIATGNPLFDWEFETTPQPQAQNRVIPVPRGKLLGGSSGINGLAFGRASAPEYDIWDKFAPNQSWTFRGLLPFFLKSENVALSPTNPYPGISPQSSQQAASDGSSFEGFKGPVNVSYNAFYPDVVPTYVKTVNALGISTNANPDSGIATGISNSRASVDRQHGTRSYSATAYYCGLPPRPNLHILLQAQVTKVILSKNKSNFAATGVSFVVGSQAFSANATREVILSAGTVQTPQLLELSGIGNSALLSSFGIPTLINLPQVGENLQEHLFSLVQWQLQPGHLTFDEMRNNATFAAEQTSLYAETGQGVLAATDSAVTFIPLDKLVSEQELSSMLAIFDQEAAQPGLSPLLKMQLPIQRSWLTGSAIAHVELIHWSRGSIAPAPNVSYITALAGVSHPTSRGFVHISSSDPTAKPTVNPRFLSTQFDQRSLLNAMKYHQKVAQTPPLSNVIVTQTNPPANESDADLLTWIQSTCQGGDHLIGTAAMAPQNVGGVVNPELIVYGTSNLRVVDASVIPLHIAAHTQSTVYAIAEKAAQMILSAN